jgi:hypothetical protein
MKRAAKLKRESRFKEIMLALLFEEFGALCNAASFNSKQRIVASQFDSRLS